MAGAASCRVHRPTSGIGLDEIAQACIGAARKIEGVVKFWEGTPRMELLKDREPDEAYLAAKPGERYTLLSPTVVVWGWICKAMRGIPHQVGRYRKRRVGPQTAIDGGRLTSIAAPGPGLGRRHRKAKMTKTRALGKTERSCRTKAGDESSIAKEPKSVRTPFIERFRCAPLTDRSCRQSGGPPFDVHTSFLHSDPVCRVLRWV